MHHPRSRRSRSTRAPCTWWWTHLYIAAIAVVVQAPSGGQPPVREVLNSERIATAFGSYGIEVLEQDEAARVSNLFCTTDGERTCRTCAIVLYASHIDPAVSAEHAVIVAGGSIGAVFAAQGWEVRKTHLSYAERPASARLASLMRIDVATPLAEHVYVLDVVKGGSAVEYAALVEIHHPAYLDVHDLAEIYGPVDERGKELVAELRATADGHAR